MEEKPLHVKVAEALGWSAFKSKHEYWIITEPDGTRHEDGFGRPNPKFNSETGEKLPEMQWWHEYDPPHYDTDWSATGPLIEKYGLELIKGYDCYHCSTNFGDGGVAQEEEGYGPTPLIAICKAILSLKEAGKL